MGGRTGETTLTGYRLEVAAFAVASCKIPVAPSSDILLFSLNVLSPSSDRSTICCCRLRLAEHERLFLSCTSELLACTRERRRLSALPGNSKT
ncbi:hypothetical protein EVAR_19558_1 [Eumeta japonica]|uniref:Uncharacterized protein n=1 Tax=Eumeta variegata TaxID=151549 RepID=A0A4C1UFA5_EUMVA|nr:hypothetical protein EVAR_19558_1 [Eumeta japonica]